MADYHVKQNSITGQWTVYCWNAPVVTLDNEIDARRKAVALFRESVSQERDRRRAQQQGEHA